MRLRHLLSLLLLAACFGCSDSDHSDHHIAAVSELLDTGIDRYLNAITPMSSQVKNGWTEYYYDPAREEAICLTGGRYQVNVRPGTVNKVLLYLEGGGACWNEQTCYNSPLAKISANGAVPVGILTDQIESNPFKDWNVVYAPYCDGSVFGGDNEPVYGSHRTFHHGLQNLSAAVTQMLQEFPNPEQIVVSGSSAGGYGTFTGYGVVRVAYPETQVLTLDDSGPGLQNPNDATTMEQRLANWKFDELIPPSCTRCGEQVTYLTEWALERDPLLRVGYFNYLQDGVLQFFLGLDGPHFETLLRSVTDELRATQPERFKRFLPAGVTHTILMSAEFYTLKVDGVSMRDWTADFLTDGARWQDVAD